MGRDFVGEMLKAKSTEEKVEIYLIAEPVLPEEGLEALVFASGSKEIKAIYAEKLEQEKVLEKDGYVIPRAKEEDVLDKTTHEKWNQG